MTIMDEIIDEYVRTFSFPWEFRVVPEESKEAEDINYWKDIDFTKNELICFEEKELKLFALHELERFLGILRMANKFDVKELSKIEKVLQQTREEIIK